MCKKCYNISLLLSSKKCHCFFIKRKVGSFYFILFNLYLINRKRLVGGKREVFKEKFIGRTCRIIIMKMMIKSCHMSFNPSKTAIKDINSSCRVRP